MFSVCLSGKRSVLAAGVIRLQWLGLFAMGVQTLLACTADFAIGDATNNQH